ncbi:DUF4231 domain-containing protein [Nocardia cyriacigeorgica]|uniref:DUF4231 domain-containing protein n=1 Tax=Nocardia cyriacigeorgica TaxID=135487 RepID=UPI00189552B0|nr:DUF4231 domain-containing protein [Nocardia cyriacigeorgica]MBF6318641.1 DUF4231 domain-containing protein [Nocardia cyriacigeorgica]MBF6531848.1 DUF4231 domain-containing protein [Nocardia cyriacigeorgica]
MTTEDDPVWARLTDQIRWYSSKSSEAQRAYRRVKFGQIVVGSTVPVLAGLSAPAAVTAAVAVTVVVAEGAQQLFQWHTNWMLYRSTAEALKREKFLFLAGAGPYTGTDARATLAARVETLVSATNNTWAAEHERQSTSAASTPVALPDGL